MSKNTSIVLGIIVVVLIVLGGVYIFSMDPKGASETGAQMQDETQVEKTQGAMEETEAMREANDRMMNMTEEEMRNMDEQKSADELEDMTGEKGQTDNEPRRVSNESSDNVYTMAQVRSHNSVESCWVAINGFVYDETKWIARHPGGRERILNICGTNATEQFTGQHKMSARAKAQLASMKIGRLAQ